MVVQVLHDVMDHLQHLTDAHSSHGHTNRLHHLDDRVGFLVWTDGKLPWVVCLGRLAASLSPGTHSMMSLIFLFSGSWDIFPSSGKLGMDAFEEMLDDQIH